MLAAIADLSIAGNRKVPHFGALAAKLGTSCARLLAERPDALPHLARLHQRAAHPPQGEAGRATRGGRRPRSGARSMRSS